MQASDYLKQIRGDQRAMSNPIIKNTLDMLDRKDSDGLKQLFNNVCNSYGVNPTDYLNRFKK